MTNYNTIQSLAIKQITSEFGTPLYIYDGDTLVSNYKTLKNAIPDFVDVFYALKVNPNISLVSLFKSHGANAEVCSLIEMEIAIRAGVAPKNIIFLGPSKREDEIARALELDIYALVVESVEELYRVSRIAGERNLVANVAIRINPSFAAATAPLKMGGRPTQFGIEESQVLADFGEYKKLPHINIRGIHVYNGSRILQAETCFENTKNILNLFDRISREHDMDFSMVDVGGGMGVPYFNNEQPLDMDIFEALMKPLFIEFNQKYPNTRIIMESGRYLAGTSGIFVSKVNNIKEAYGETFAITDGGTNCHMSAVGVGSVVRRNFPLVNLSNDNMANTQPYHIAGPLCNPDDLTARNIDLAEIMVGDLIAIKASGAYGPTASPVLFHSHGHPAEVLVHNGRAQLIRHRDTAEDLINRHVLVDTECLEEVV